MPRTATFSVQGESPFPLDMLRHDGCWPADTESVWNIYISITHGAIQSSLKSAPARPTIRLRSTEKPTVARWASFGWRVL